MKPKLMNPALDVIHTLCNFIVLNLVFLITCIPVLTIGTALSSLYYVVGKEAAGEYGYLVRTYLREFKRNLKSGTLAFGILFFVGAVLLFNLAFWYSLDSILSAIVTAIVFVACVVWFLVFTYTFPLIARFENSIKQTIKNALALSICNGKTTFALLFIDAFLFFFCFFLPPAKLLMVLFGFAFLAYCQSFLFLKVFEPYETQS